MRKSDGDDRRLQTAKPFAADLHRASSRDASGRDSGHTFGALQQLRVTQRNRHELTDYEDTIYKTCFPAQELPGEYANLIGS
jgi:hypothetical protein